MPFHTIPTNLCASYHQADLKDIKTDCASVWRALAPTLVHLDLENTKLSNGVAQLQLLTRLQHLVLSSELQRGGATCKHPISTPLTSCPSEVDATAWHDSSLPPSHDATAVDGSASGGGSDAAASGGTQLWSFLAHLTELTHLELHKPGNMALPLAAVKHSHSSPPQHVIALQTRRLARLSTAATSVRS